MPVVSAVSGTPAGLFNAKQVQAVGPVGTGIIKFLDGSAQIFGVTADASQRSFVPSQNVGNVVPNPGDWILELRAALNQALGVNGTQGAQTLAYQLQTPVAPIVQGAYYYYTNAQYQQLFGVDYSEYTPNQGIVP